MKHTIHRLRDNPWGAARTGQAMKPAALTATIFLALVALAHFLRLVLRIEVIAGSVTIPLWLSAVACVFTGGLAGLLWRESRGH